jgi:UDP-glucose 4-epimerase
VRVAVTGATGNIGTALVRALLDDPAVTSVVGIARRRPSWTADVEWVEADVRHDDLLPAFTGADVVVHLAWFFQPTHDPVTTWAVNAVGSTRVFAAAAEAGVGALVHASSVGGYSPGPADGSPVDESWPTHALPHVAYGREKAYVERALDGFEASHPAVRVVRLRPGFVFQRRAAPEQWRIFGGRLLPRGVLGHRLVPVVPDLPGLRFPALHAADAAEAFRLAVVRDDARGAYNVAAEPVVDAALLASVLGARQVPMPAWPVRAAVAASWHLRLQPTSPHLVDLVLAVPVMDTARIRTELGWEPRHTAVEALEALVEGMREGRGAPTPPLAA